jgi:uncharacterized protein (TIGR02231 family)
MTATKSFVCAYSLLLLGVGVSARAAPPENAPHSTEGKITAVTLYRGQALVTRTVSVEGPPGSQELIVAGLPEQIVPDSLYAEAGEALEIRAVRFRIRAVGEEPRKEIRSLEEEMEALRETLQVNQKEQQVLLQRAAYLDKMEAFTVQTGHTDLARGFLDAAALEKLTTFAFAQRDAINSKSVSLEKAAKDINKELQLLVRKRDEMTAGHQKAVREAIIFIEKSKDGKKSLCLNYLVGKCGWSPTYTVRAGKDRKEMALECSALINQLTGEEWTGVNLTLSTASPSLAASSPGLAPVPISLVPAAQSARMSEREVFEQVQSIKGKKSGYLARQRTAVTFEESVGSSWGVNAAANEYQTLELATGRDLFSTAGAGSRETEGPSLTYRLGVPVSLASRAEQQMVRVFRTSFKSEFYCVAVPVLTSQVYREAELLNTSDEDLLAGPITVYLEDRFMGRAEIMTVARGQTFAVGFGADPQLRARRELADRTEVLQGGNRELAFKYRLVVENFKKEPAPVRVFDRLPYSDRPNDVRVRLGETKDPLSTDKVYLRSERPKGLLRWDITVDGMATADKARIIEYGFTIDFDRNLAIQVMRDVPAQPNPAASPAMRQQMQEFRSLQIERAGGK